MKLYATVSSERATKGQGGNEYLLINILDERQEKIIQVHITQAKSHLRGDHQNIYIYNPKAEYIDISQNGFIETKGKQQKDECKHKDANGNACWNCESGFDNCGDNTTQ